MSYNPPKCAICGSTHDLQRVKLTYVCATCVRELVAKFAQASGART